MSLIRGELPKWINDSIINYYGVPHFADEGDGYGDGNHHAYGNPEYGLGDYTDSKPIDPLVALARSVLP